MRNTIRLISSVSSFATRPGSACGAVVDAVESPAHACSSSRSIETSEEPGDSLENAEILVPFVYDAVPVVDLAEGYLVVVDSIPRMRRIDIFTLVPEAFAWFLDQHPVSTAIAAGAVEIAVHNSANTADRLTTRSTTPRMGEARGW